MKISTMKQAEEFLISRITQKFSSLGKGLERTKYLLKLLGNPQEKARVIHIAGTSGKGSTAMILSHALSSQGFKVGLHVSPHISDIRERFQINNKLPSGKKLISCLNEIIPAIDITDKSSYGPVSYFEAMVALCFYFFKSEGVDYAVMETGLGGLYDATNCVSNPHKIAILTRIGYDHTRILGRRLAEIAFQKASIIHPGNRVIALRQGASVNNAIKQVADINKAPIQWIKARDYKIIKQLGNGLIFDSLLHESFKKIGISAGGKYQAENASLALACLLYCASRDNFSINEKALRKELASMVLPGRMQEIKFKNKKIILDGAHNPQKMEAFLSSLASAYPGRKFAFILSFKKGKEYKKMLRMVMPLAKSIAITDFYSNQENYPQPVNLGDLKSYLLKAEFKKIISLENNKKKFLNYISSIKDDFVITGSFYLLSTLKHYFEN